MEAVRRLAMALPGVEEGTSYGTPAFRVRGSLFVRLHDGGEALVVKTEPDARAALMASDPGTYFITDHYTRYPWVLVRLATVVEDELARVLAAAWRLAAPPRLAAAHDGGGDGPATKRPAAKRPKDTPPRKPAAPLARLRKLCLALPEAHEVEAWGEPTFRERNKMFAMYADAANHHGNGRPAVWVKAAPGDQAALVAADPEGFFVPPYVGPSGWVGVRLDGPVPWDDVAGFLRDAYRLVAPKRLLALLDGGSA
jgi:hypothetical protein